MKILIELYAHIEIWWWHLCKTILSYLYLTIDDKILAETSTNNAIGLITTTTKPTTSMETYPCVNDNCYYLKGRHNNNEQLLVLFVDSNKLNNSNMSNNNNNIIIISKRYKYNTKSRQTDNNGHNESIVVVVLVLVYVVVIADNDVDDDCDFDLNKSNRKSSRNRQRIVNANNKNHSSKQNKNNSANTTSLCVDNFGVGYKIPNCRMLPTPLATCLLLLCNLLLSSSFLTLFLFLLFLLLLSLLCFSFPPPLHLVVSTTTWLTTHFISILSDKRVFSIRTHNVKKKTKYGCYYQMKINRGLLFNGDHYLNAITTNKQQQQNQIQSFISKITTTKCANILFSKIVNFKVSLR